MSQSIQEFNESASGIRTGLAAFLLLAGLIGLTHVGGLPNIPRRDEIYFLRERMLTHSAQEWVWHCLSFNRTRHTGQGDFYLFRPGLFGTHALLDVVFGYNVYVVGVSSLLMLLACSFATYLALAKLVPRSLALLLAALVCVQYAGIELVLWRHISPYLIALACLAVAMRMACRLPELPARSGIRWPAAWGIAACVFLGALFHEMAAATGLLAAGWIGAVILWERWREQPAASDPSRGALWTVAAGALAGSIAYLAVDLADYWLHQTPGVLGPADQLPTRTAIIERVYSSLAWIGSAVYGQAFPFGVKLRQDWSKGGLYGWIFNPASRLLALLGLLVVVAAIAGVAYVSTRRSREGEPRVRQIQLAGILLLSYALTLFLSIGVGRIFLRDVTYIQNATYYFGFTGWLICAGAGVTLAIARQHGRAGTETVLWHRASLVIGLMVAMNFFQTFRLNLRERGLRYQFAARQTGINSALTSRGLHLAGLKPGSELKFGDMPTQTMLTRSPHPVGSAPAYLCHDEDRICLAELLQLPSTKRRQPAELDLAGTRFKERDGWYFAPVSGNVFRHGEAFLIGRTESDAGTVSVRVRKLWHGGLVVAHRDSENFVLFGLDFGWAYAVEMIDGTISQHLGGTTLLQPLPEEYTLRTVMLDDRLCLMADDRILTSLKPTRPRRGAVGIWVDKQYAPTEFRDLTVDFDGPQAVKWKLTAVTESGRP